MTTAPPSLQQLPVDRALGSVNGQEPSRATIARAEAWKRRLPLMPALIYVIIVTQAPFAVTLWYSFRRWNLLIPGSNKFAGFQEYRAAFDDPAFRQAAVRTVEMTASAVIFAMLVGTGMALLVNRKFFGRGVVRTLLITPFLIMPVATDLLFKTTIYDPVFGFLDYVLKPFGVGQVNWLGTHAVGSIVVVLVWEWAPFMMLIVLAGLQGEDLEALEAAQVDGASTIKTFVYITFPNIKRYMELGVLLGSIYIVQTFGEVFTMTAGGPGTATTNLPYYLYEQVFNNFTVGVGAAAGIIVLILTEIVATFALRLLSGLLRASVTVA
jgi:sorbitol/mannitol transport system permease protein